MPCEGACVALTRRVKPGECHHFIDLTHKIYLSHEARMPINKSAKEEF